MLQSKYSIHYSYLLALIAGSSQIGEQVEVLRDGEWWQARFRHYDYWVLTSASRRGERGEVSMDSIALTFLTFFLGVAEAVLYRRTCEV